MTGAAKTVPGKATAGQFHYHDFSWIGYGRSSFEEGRALLDAKDDHKDKTQATGGLLTVSIVRIDDATRPAQAVATVEAEGPVLAGIVEAVAERVKNLSIPESNWSDAASILKEVDFENDGGLVIVNPSLSEHAPIDRWFQFNLSVTFEVDEGASADVASAGKQSCSGCGEMIDGENGFCPMCGKQNPFAGAGQEGNVFCTNCGSPLAEGTRFCGKCGAPASGAAPPPAYANQYPPQAVPVATRPKKTSKLIIERRRGSGLVFDKSSIWSWDVLIDGKRVDALYDTGSKVTIERDEGFICFLRCNNDIYQETNELRIPVATGQTKQVAVIYKKALFGWTFETVPW
jgi:RNA polymerase subunit RPABC4/transcription elongation factor Spt4